MAERRPLIIRDGLVEEIPVGDTISTVIAPGSGGGGGGFISAPHQARFFGAMKPMELFTPTGIATFIQPVLGAPVFDTHSFNGTNVLTVPAGVTKVRLSGMVRPSGTASDNQWLLYKNGFTFPVTQGGVQIEVSEDSYTNGGVTWESGIIDVVQGDTFSLRYYVAATIAQWTGWIQIEAIEHTLDTTVLPDVVPGDAGKSLIVNGTEDGFEWTTVTGSGVYNNIFIEDQIATTGYQVAVSGTAAATKGNLVIVQYDVDVKSVQFQANEATPVTYEAVIAEYAPTTIGTVLGRVSATSVGGTDENIDFVFPNKIRLNAGQTYAILITQKGGTGATTLDSTAGDGPLTGVLSSFALGGSIADNDIQGGESWSTFSNSYVGMVVNYDVVYNANGIGSGILSGTVDPTTEGNNGDFYLNTSTNTMFGPKAADIWPAGADLKASANMVLGTTITASRDLTNADLAGRVFYDVGHPTVPIVINIPLGLTGTEPVTFQQVDAAAVSFTIAGGGTLKSLNDYVTIAGDGGSVSLVPKGSDVYGLIGALIA